MRSSLKRASVAMAVALILQVSAPVEVAAQTSVTIDIPAQPLADAIQAVARQAGVNILVDPKLVAGRQAPAVSQQSSVSAALNVLLEGTGLQPRYADDKTITLVTTPATSSSVEEGLIETVNVFASLESQLSVGSKSGQSLRETPKSVTLVTRERIEAQNLTSLADTLKQTTGITVTSYTSADNAYFSRGFRVQTVQIDGGAPAISNSFGAYLTPDTAAYERVEMLRGVDGMYTGAGEPGGVINLIRKRAKSTPAAQVNMSVGRWNAYRGELDLTGPLTEDGRLRGRVVGAYENRDYFYDRGKSDKKYLFGTAEYDLTESTVLIAGGSYERRKEDGFFFRGLPRYADGRDLNLPRSTAFNPDWNHNYTTTKEVFARVEQQYGSTGVLKVNLTRLDQQSERALMNAYGAVDTANGTLPQALGNASTFGAVQDLFDVSASGKFSLFGAEHRYTVGADYANVDGGGQRGYDLLTYRYPSSRTIDVFNFDPSQYPLTGRIETYRYPKNGQKQHGFYGTVGLQLAEPVRLTLGGRYAEFRYESIYLPILANGTAGTASPSIYEDTAFIPSAALSWDFATNWSVYASYAQSFKPQANLLKGPLPGSPLDPVTGDGYEFGVKGELPGGLNAAVAAYRIKRLDQGMLDPSYPFTPGGNGINCCYVQRVDIQSEGFDAELSGTVLPGWQVFGGYTFNQSEYDGGAAQRSCIPAVRTT